MSTAARSLISRIKGSNTGLEQRFELLLTDAGLVAERHAKDLPGRPDFVFRRQRMVVFTAGDFLAWLAVLGL
jgi:DNA mismatch endonuclease (patch repair protein)